MSEARISVIDNHISAPDAFSCQISLVGVETSASGNCYGSLHLSRDSRSDQTISTDPSD